MLCLNAQIQLNVIFKIIIKKGAWELGTSAGNFSTFVQVLQGLQDTPAEGGHGVLHAGAEAEQALQVGLTQQLLPVRDELRRAAEQGGHVVYKLRHQAGVGIVGLAVVISHNLAKRKEQKTLCLHQSHARTVVKAAVFPLVSLICSGR